jgi:fucose permease
VGTFTGGSLADWLSRGRNDRRWYLWLPAIGTFLCVPLQFFAYLSPDRSIVPPAFAAMTFMASGFFGPSFAMTQAISPLRMRSVATSLLLLVQAVIGQGIGPWLTGSVSDSLRASMGRLAPLLAGLRWLGERLGGPALLHRREVAATGSRWDGATVVLARLG